MRKEEDFLGEKLIPEDALFGIHSLRAKENFPGDIPFQVEWYKAVGLVKKAFYMTYKSYKKALEKKTNGDSSLTDVLFADDIIESLIQASTEVAEGKHFEYFIVKAVSGGAGTSINLNVNEIICNRALQINGLKPGMYNVIDPIEHANIYQSTNDVIPTSLRLAVMQQLIILEQSVNELRYKVEELENKYRDTLRVGYTQMQEAVPTTFGKLFSAYSESLSRDWWRVSKCFERIKTINLGGSAIGTGITVPRFFIMEASPTLQKLSGLPVTRSENMSDTTSNLDAFVEVHAILKAHAVNLEKMVSDLRLLSSDIVSSGELKIPNKQLGSTIMPGKVNPVIPEFVISSAHKIYSNDSLITNLCAMGCLELNAYLPLIGHALIESIKMLICADKSLKENMISGVEVNAECAREKLFHSPAVTTALVPYIGYNNASVLAKEMKLNGISIIEANRKLKLISEDKLENVLKPSNLLKTGFTLNDLSGE